MADGTKTINNTQEVVGVFAMARPGGEPIAITGLVATIVSGDGSFSTSTDRDGNPLPVDQMAFISGSNSGVTEYAVDVQNADGISKTAQILLTVVNAIASLSITFMDPVAKREATPPTP